MIHNVACLFIISDVSEKYEKMTQHVTIETLLIPETVNKSVPNRLITFWLPNILSLHLIGISLLPLTGYNSVLQGCKYDFLS